MQVSTVRRRARWDGCWIRLLDGLLQAGWLQAGSARLRVPTRIRRLAIPAPLLVLTLPYPTEGAQECLIHQMQTQS